MGPLTSSTSGRYNVIHEGAQRLQRVIHNAQDGSVAAAHLFVAGLGASNNTYVEAFADEQLAARLAAHCHAFAFFRGVARITVPDNLKTGVTMPTGTIKIGR